MSAPPGPSELSAYLRTGSDPEVRRRRALVGLSLVGMVMGQVVTALQTGLVHTLPDPPGPFDSARVDASDYAYRSGAPDGPAMLATYALTALLASAGGQDRASYRPVLPLLTAAKVAADVVTCVALAREEWRENRALCAYCQLATVVSVVSLPLALPEARRAWAARRGR